MLHGRRVRPRGAGANTVENDTPLKIDESSISHIPGAQVVQIDDFIGVVAPKEYDAIQAAAQLKVTWLTSNGFPQGSGNFWSWLRQVGDTNTAEPGPVHDERRQPEDGACGSGEEGQRHVQVSLQQLHADRPARRGRGRQCERRNRLRPGAGPTALPANLAGIIDTVTGKSPPRRTCGSSGTRARARSEEARPAR